MKLADLIFWAGVFTIATGSTSEVLDRLESWFGHRPPAQTAPAEKQQQPAKKDPNEIQTDW